MNSGRYWLTRAAENDLADIAKYTLETWGEKRLLIYRQRLEQRLDFLIEFPEMGRNHPMLRSDFRYMVEGKHYIFYHSIDIDIEILRFLHCRSDIISKLSAYL
ncbi:MAG: type II toxin-antitoxin system RelE/ParE family toxin [Pseudomonadota bacterium]|nr:type II toxin-antitoxin system RelE/ParE family toxin [Pseudomonadota bacterium]MEA3240629.1 type II toxin-antitoxin system RelE/ParE family toxin [Pseudomonadota bacterium]